MADLWSLAKAKVGDQEWAYALKAVGWSTPEDAVENTPDANPADIELFLSRCQMAVTLTGDDKLESFVQTCEQVIVQACQFVSPDTPLPVHEDFLRRVARRPTRLPRTQLFTTNYDLAFETAASSTGFAVIDGFSHAAPQRFDSAFFDVDLAVRDKERAATAVDWMPNVVRLVKLHGSVDWAATDSGVVRESSPEHPLIVYPRDTKFEVSYQQPFLELMGRFQAALRQPDTALLIVGCGLNDRHLTEPILAAIRANVRMSVIVVAPGLKGSKNATIASMGEFIGRKDRRLALLDGTFEGLVQVLPELVPETEAEQHGLRVTA